MDVKSILDRLYAARSPQHLANDPLSFCHRYGDPADREVAAVIASAFAYGGIKIILRTLETIFAELGPSPRSYVETFDPGKALKTFMLMSEASAAASKATKVKSKVVSKYGIGMLVSFLFSVPHAREEIILEHELMVERRANM